MKNEILRVAFRIAHQQTDIAVAVAAIGRYPVEAIAKTLDVARSNRIERAGKKRSKRAPYCKTDDSKLLSRMKELVDARPTYGYRRITALLNRAFNAASQPRANNKRVYRIMQLYDMLLQRHTGRRIERAHDGVVRTLRSNMRWYPMASRSRVGMEESSASRSRSTRAIGKQSRGLPRLPA